MKRYKLLKDLPGFKAGEVVKSGYLVFNLIGQPVDSVCSYFECEKFPDWFEKVEESQEEPDWFARPSKLGEVTASGEEPEEKEECKHERASAFLTKDSRMCPDCISFYTEKPQPKQKPSQTIENKMWEYLGENYADYDIEPARLRATIDFLDDQFANSQDKE